MFHQRVVAALAAWTLAGTASAASNDKSLENCVRTNPEAKARFAALSQCLEVNAGQLVKTGQLVPDLAQAMIDQCVPQQKDLQGSLTACSADATASMPMVWRLGSKIAKRTLDGAPEKPSGHGVDAIRDPNEDRR